MKTVFVISVSLVSWLIGGPLAAWGAARIDEGQTEDLSQLTETITVTPFPAIEGEPLKAGCLSFLGGLVLTGSERWGGLSSWWLMDGEALLLSDAGYLFKAGSERDTRGAISAVGPVAQHRALFPKVGDKALTKSQADTEGLVVDDDGSLLISIEGQHRIDRFVERVDGWRVQETLFTSQDRRLEQNRGFEGLTALADGSLLTVSEGRNRQGEALLVYLKAHSDSRQDSRDSSGGSEGHAEFEAHLGAYRPLEGYAVTDLAMDKVTGDLFVLERRFSRARGPEARIGRITKASLDTFLSKIGGADDASALEAQTLGRLSVLHGIDNMEGLAVERDVQGDRGPIIHLLSDDNFSDIQRTVTLSFELDEACAVGM